MVLQWDFSFEWSMPGWTCRIKKCSTLSRGGSRCNAASIAAITGIQNNDSAQQVSGLPLPTSNMSGWMSRLILMVRSSLQAPYPDASDAAAVATVRSLCSVCITGQKGLKGCLF